MKKSLKNEPIPDRTTYHTISLTIEGATETTYIWSCENGIKRFIPVIRSAFRNEQKAAATDYPETSS